MSEGGDETESLRARDGGESPSLPVGSVVLGKYRVERSIGRGGMGEVYEATHTTLGSRVALKLPLGQAATGTAGARLLREAQVAASLDPERVVRVLDVGVLGDGRPVLVLERLEGCTLADRLADGTPLEPIEAVDFTIGACLGLVEAHARSIVHRDIKPSNLFIARRRDGTSVVKVLDFGVAALRASTGEADVRLTDSHAPVGSPPYMAPEQLRGRDVDPRTDVWGLGVTLFELLSAERPFVGPTPAAIAAAIVADPPRRLADLRADVPRELLEIIRRCLEKEPDARPEHALALAIELAPLGSAQARAQVQAVERASGPARETSEARPAPKHARVSSTPTQHASSADSPPTRERRPGWLWLGGLVLLAPIVVWATSKGSEPSPAVGASEPEPSTPTREATSAATARSSSLAVATAEGSPTSRAATVPPTASIAQATSAPPSLAAVVRRRPTSSAQPSAAPTAAQTTSGPKPIMDERKF